MDQKKSKEYWEKRARENENKVYKKASDLKKELDVHYVQAKKEIQKSINDLIARYMFKTDLSYADAMKYLTSKEFRMSLEEYEFLAKIDSRTSEICKKLNGEKFKVKDARAGVNYPPMHPHCRSTTVAVLDFDNFGKEKDSFEKHKIVDRESVTSKWERRKEFENEIEDIINYQGFDGLPRIVKKDKFEKLVQEDHFLAKRSYSANSSDQMEERKNELYYGKWYVTCSVGGAQYGQGMYCAADYTKSTKIKELTEEMEHYTSLNKRRGSPFYRVETLTLDKSAKILDFNSYEKRDRLKLISCLARRYVEINSKFFGIDKRYFDKTLPEELLKENEDIYFNVWNKISDDMFKKRRDIGAVAAALGYDAINAKGHGAILIQ